MSFQNFSHFHSTFIFFQDVGLCDFYPIQIHLYYVEMTFYKHSGTLCRFQQDHLALSTASVTYSLCDLGKLLNPFLSWKMGFKLALIS